MSKKVLVTGASRGIGYAIAESFALHGYEVFATYNKTSDTLPALSDALAAHGASLIPIHCDVSSEESIKKMFSEIEDIDILVNNAGIAHVALLSDITTDDWDRIFDTNLKSVFLTIKEASKSMIAKQSGKIINISSVWGLYGGACESHYSATKAGMIGLTKALAKELGPSGICVNCIAPGVIDTDMNADLSAEDIAELCDRTPLGKIGKPSDVAHAALFLAEADFVTGEVISVGGGFTM